MRRIGKVFGVLLLGAIVTGMTVWAMGVLYYIPLPPRLRGPLALTFGLATAGAFLGLPRRRWTLLGFGLAWGAVVLWWSTIPASNIKGFFKQYESCREGRKRMRWLTTIGLKESLRYAAASRPQFAPRRHYRC